jgi:serine/threonine protein kinase
MARIYLARTTGIGAFERFVVLKLIIPERQAEAQAVHMFLDEARLAASLNHQNVAQVMEVGEENGIHYLAMEYVHGQDLRALLAKAGSLGIRVPLDLALTVVAGATAGLFHAHERRGPDGTPLNIVHRDVSPSNIMIGYDGSVKMLDFGIAKASVRSVETQSGIIKGKFAYMSPEQCRGKDVDRRSDVFSLGIILYEVTTQHRCFRAESDFDTMHRIVTGDVVRPSKILPNYPAVLESIVYKALAVDVAQRYQNAGQLLEALEAWAVQNRVSLSTMSLGRFMRDLFGDVPEPWLVSKSSSTGRGLQPEGTVSSAAPMDLSNFLDDDGPPQKKDLVVPIVRASQTSQGFDISNADIDGLVSGIDTPEGAPQPRSTTAEHERLIGRDAPARPAPAAEPSVAMPTQTLPTQTSPTSPSPKLRPSERTDATPPPTFDVNKAEMRAAAGLPFAGASAEMVAPSPDTSLTQTRTDVVESSPLSRGKAASPVAHVSRASPLPPATGLASAPATSSSVAASSVAASSVAAPSVAPGQPVAAVAPSAQASAARRAPPSASPAAASPAAAVPTASSSSRPSTPSPARPSRPLSAQPAPAVPAPAASAPRAASDARSARATEPDLVPPAAEAVVTTARRSAAPTVPYGANGELESSRARRPTTLPPPTGTTALAGARGRRDTGLARAARTTSPPPVAVPVAPTWDQTVAMSPDEVANNAAKRKMFLIVFVVAIGIAVAAAVLFSDGNSSGGSSSGGPGPAAAVPSPAAVAGPPIAAAGHSLDDARTVAVSITTVPPRARVIHDGRQVGITPFNAEVRRTPSEGPLDYIITADGYNEELYTARPEKSEPVHFVLRPVVAPAVEEPEPEPRTRSTSSRRSSSRGK